MTEASNEAPANRGGVSEGDTVRFFFQHQRKGGAGIEYRTATVTKLWPADLDNPGAVYADLQVNFTEDDEHMGFAKTQVHHRLGVPGRVQSGEWMPIPAAHSTR